MKIDALERLGLSKGESNAYLALNKLGPSTSGKIAREYNDSHLV